MDDNRDSQWIKEFLARLDSKKEEGVGKEKPTPSEPTKEENSLPVVSKSPTGEEDDKIITLIEDDVESGEMFNRQQQYEEELMQLPPDHPKNKFPHSFLRKNFLPVVVSKSKKTEKAEFSDVAEEIKHEAYYENRMGFLKLDHKKFCSIWRKRFGYVYAGFIITPEGAVDPETFRSEIVKMLFEIGVERQNYDSLADHLYKTYISAYKVDAYNEPNKIPFRNGDLVLNEDKKGFVFYEGCLSPVPYRFDYDFKNIPNCEEPKFPNFKKWKNELFSEEDQYTLKQMLGYLLIPSNDAQEAFFIVGKGGSGKSVVTDCIIPKMLGDASFPMSVGRFFDNNFQTSCSEGKLCMIDDDIGETKLSMGDAGRFKNFVSARTIQIEHKHCNPVKINNSSRIVCSGNHMINSDDKTDGFVRRLHPIYAKPRTIKKVDRHFYQKIEKEIEMIVLWALEGLLEMFYNDGAPYWSERTDVNMEYYAETQKWEEQFVTDCFEFKEETVTYSTEVQDALQAWIKDNSEVCGEGSLQGKFRAVTRWLADEGMDKYGYVYKRGIKRGNSYNARGYVNMALRKPVANPDLFYGEDGNLKIRLKKRKPEDQVDK